MARRRQQRIRPNPATIQLRRTLKELGLRPRKSLGQHFLVDSQVLSRILQAAQITPEDVVVEVGPGLGVLTKELAKRARHVVAVELDDHLAALLQQEILRPLSNVTVIHADILKTDPSAMLSSVGQFPQYKVVADLPYYITSSVLRHFLEASAKPHLMVLMVQKEVGQAIVAEPGNMSVLSASVQYYSKPTIVDRVPSRSFYPSPKVDSIILRIDLYDHPIVDVPSTEEFFRVVKAGFSARRKQLRNSLAQGLQISPSEAEALLDEAEVSPQRRAESLSLPEWARVCHAMCSRGPKC